MKNFKFLLPLLLCIVATNNSVMAQLAWKPTTPTGETLIWSLDVNRSAIVGDDRANFSNTVPNPYYSFGAVNYSPTILTPMLPNSQISSNNYTGFVLEVIQNNTVYTIGSVPTSRDNTKFITATIKIPNNSPVFFQLANIRMTQDPWESGSFYDYNIGFYYALNTNRYTYDFEVTNSTTSFTKTIAAGSIVDRGKVISSTPPPATTNVFPATVNKVVFFPGKTYVLKWFVYNGQVGTYSPDNPPVFATQTTIHVDNPALYFDYAQPSYNADMNAGLIGKTINGNVATNDNNISGVTVSYGTPTAVSGKTNPDGTMPSMSSTGAYTFTPASVGNYYFNVPITITDPNNPGNNTTINAPLTISVTKQSGSVQIETAPDFSTITWPASGTPTATINVLSNDKVLIGNGTNVLPTLSGTLTTPPKNGTATVNTTTGIISYTPNAGFVGVDTIGYEACSPAPNAVCQTQYAYVTVNQNGTENIVASDDIILTSGPTKVSGNVATNDVSTNGTKTLTTQNISNPNYDFVLRADGTYDFTPKNGFTGTVNLPYTVTNGTTSVGATLVVVVSTFPLPITLGQFTATIVNGQLVINWSTLMEKNFDHFLVEVSKDGVNWKVLEKVSSKSLNGNSETELKYTLIKSIGETISLMGLSFSSMGLLMLVVFSLLFSMSRYKKAKILFALLFAISLSGTLASCTKNNDASIERNKSKIYVRITSVDRDGKTETFKVIQAVQE